MERRFVFAAAVIAVLVIAAVGVFFARAEDEPGAKEYIDRALTAMADEEFAARLETCADCPPGATLQLAPPDRFLMSGSAGHDDWEHYLWTGGAAYYSSEGVRWRTGEEEGWRIALLMLNDPRFLLRVIEDIDLERGEPVDGRETVVVTGRITGRAFMAALPPGLSMTAFPPEAIDSIYGPARVHVAIDREEHLVRASWLVHPDEPEPNTAAFDYDAPVDIPEQVVAMPSDELDDLHFDAKNAAIAILNAIGRYHERHGAYPPDVDQATLSGVMESPWPTNPYTGQPVSSGDGPGEVTYTLIDGGTNVQFALHGWDGALVYYDSARFGPIPQQPAR
ncbi:MAG: hypothetical protein IT303_16560 [Dehalococcoidia bacterium]|nr:hypothetical protein [Dehalococcoidia bacterium]